MSVQVHLERFEGPLSLLLYLIRREEIDIYNIPIHDITNQYMKELEAMSQCDLEVAGDFVAMAATLLHIKSKMLLPMEEADGDEEGYEDPRKGLVEKLLIYQSYKDVSQALYARPLLGRDLWARGVRPTLPQKDGEILVDENSLFILIATYKKIFSLYGQRTHKVKTEDTSLNSCILEIKSKLVIGIRKTLKDLVGINGKVRSQLVMMFLSVLELSRIGVLSLFQSGMGSDIHIELKEEIKEDVISKVQDYKYSNFLVPKNE